MIDKVIFILALIFVIRFIVTVFAIIYCEVKMLRYKTKVLSFDIVGMIALIIWLVEYFE